MAWPDSPPQAQLDAYNAGLSGTTTSIPLRDGSWGSVPVEYVVSDDFGEDTIKPGYFYPDELEAWLNPPDPEPEPEPEPEAEPEVLAVRAFLGSTDASDATIAARYAFQKQAVLAYTRGAGFTEGQPNADLSAVVLSATARDVANPGYLASTTDGPFQRTYTRNGGGWTLQELAALNRWRKRAI